MLSYPLAVSTWGDEELEAIQEVCASGRFTMGERVKEFEQHFAHYVGSRYAVMVNSGSSANLLAVGAQFYRRQPSLQPGDEVIVPAISWSTTYYPLLQYGLRVKFVDVDPLTFNIDVSQLEAAIGPATRAVFAVNLLGNPNPYDQLVQICKDHDLLLLEDNCEALGATFGGKQTGTFGICGTFSTFFSHHICTMEGGLVVTDDEELYQILMSMRAHGWTRELPEQNHLSNKTGDIFIDHYRFVVPGYNLRPLEMSGAIGVRQLAKLPGFLAARRHNAEYFRQRLESVPGIRLQKVLPGSSDFAFAIILENELSGKRDQVVRRLQGEGIECRPIVAGCFVKNPVMRFFDYSVVGNLSCSENIDRNGLYVGNHHVDIRAQIDRFTAILVRSGQCREE